MKWEFKEWWSTIPPIPKIKQQPPLILTHWRNKPHMTLNKHLFRWIWNMFHFIVPENRIMICCFRKSFSLTIVWKSVPVINFNFPSKSSQLHSEILINISSFCKIKKITWRIIIIIIDTLVLVIIVQQKVFLSTDSTL